MFDRDGDVYFPSYKCILRIRSGILKCFSSVTRYRVIATGVKEQEEAKITYLMSMLECPFVFRL